MAKFDFSILQPQEIGLNTLFPTKKEDEVEKASEESTKDVLVKGIYTDNAKNRALNRVGQEYDRGGNTRGKNVDPNAKWAQASQEASRYSTGSSSSRNARGKVRDQENSSSKEKVGIKYESLFDSDGGLTDKGAKNLLLKEFKNQGSVGEADFEDTEELKDLINDYLNSEEHSDAGFSKDNQVNENSLKNLKNSLFSEFKAYYGEYN